MPGVDMVRDVGHDAVLQVWVLLSNYTRHIMGLRHSTNKLGMRAFKVGTLPVPDVDVGQNAGQVRVLFSNCISNIHGLWKLNKY